MSGRIIIENISDNTFNAIAALASKHGNSVEEEARIILESSIASKKSNNFIQAFKQHHEEILTRRNGMPLSDSTDMIRESRRNDLM